MQKPHFFTLQKEENWVSDQTCYASAIGQLVKTAKDKSVEKLFTKLRSWYMDKDDHSSRMAVALTFQAITR